MDKTAIIVEIQKLKKEKNAVVLAHFYQPYEIQCVADIVGDSLELAKKSKETDADILVFCGVSFMGESAALLCPDKRVLLPASNAGCYMADGITPEDVRALKNAHPDSAVVCYINSTAAVKAECDICCTSSNAVKVVQSLKEKSVIFIPDRNLGSYIASLVPEKEFYFFESGCCKIHDGLKLDAVLRCKEQYPKAKVLVHPECTTPVCAVADFIGSTAKIISYCEESADDCFIICTERGVTDRMAALMPNKHFVIPDEQQLYCDRMKEISLQMIADTLRDETGEVYIDNALKNAALAPIEKMLQI